MVDFPVWKLILALYDLHLCGLCCVDRWGSHANPAPSLQLPLRFLLQDSVPEEADLATAAGEEDLAAEVVAEEDSATEVVAEEDSVTEVAEEDSVTEVAEAALEAGEEEDSVTVEEEVDSGLLEEEDLEVEVVGEEVDSEREGRLLWSRTDMKESSSAEARRTRW